MALEYKKKTNRVETPKDQILLAVKEIVEEKRGLRETAAKYNTPKSSLSRYVLNRETVQETKYQSKYSTTQVFTTEEEKALVEYILYCSKLHYGLTKKLARDLAFQYAEANQKKCHKVRS
ncbi:hypothetical protein ANN_27877 [Periplaneta americana]|uniref:HTH psq-type domain-containing protein n=1 Tax=Periplaneta americana TaxID=6978 RepID=A0ABQ8RVD5_PERAM|nr:hypothetical protein ANN_27877 [Periplaneta americana]